MSSAAVALHAAAVLLDVLPQVSAEDLAVGLFWPTDSCMTLLSRARLTSGEYALHYFCMGLLSSATSTLGACAIITLAWAFCLVPRQLQETMPSFLPRVPSV